MFSPLVNLSRRNTKWPEPPADKTRGGRFMGWGLDTQWTGFLSSDAVEVQPSMNPAVAGSTVTLSLFPPVTFTSGNWAVRETFILTWLGEQQAVFPGYTGRASVNVTTGALTLSSLTVTDSGVYKVQSGDCLLNANVSLTVVGENMLGYIYVL
ncbi:hypothetical protein GOODEAATRI_007627 [Goodea atripinnis]|uniref:Immunoglobulin V-set domain-containing protein n=1 Tax=Goodea atripinnis TaxID=208336 RepID=A0ABV0PLP2_9TELE